MPPQDSWIANFELAGASPIPMPLTETFTGLQQGIVEATEQASNWLYANKYHTIAPNLTRTAHNFEETGVMISESVWQSPDARTAGSDPDRRRRGRGLAQRAARRPRSTSAEAAMEAEGVTIHDVDIARWQEQFRANLDTIVDQVGYSPELVDSIRADW